MLPARAAQIAAGKWGADFDEAEKSVKGRRTESYQRRFLLRLCFYFVSVYKSCCLNLHLSPSRSQTTINLKASHHIQDDESHFLSRSRGEKNANTLLTQMSLGAHI
jgi:hypothetical protein